MIATVNRVMSRMSSAEFVGLMAVISTTTAMGTDVMLPAFGEIKAGLGLAPESNSVALTVSVYFFGIAFAQIVYGPLADRFGRKPILFAGLAIYGAGAAGSMLAPSLEVLLVSRFVWGVGAASPRALSTTIVRDVYEGNRMARVMSLIMSLFLLGPIVAPLLGEGVLRVAGWRWIFGVGVALAVAIALWATRLDETLDPADRRPLGFASTGEALRAVVRNRTTLGYALSVMFGFGSLASYLASSELLFDSVYGRADQFAFIFSGAAIVSSAAAYLNARYVERLGAHRVMQWSTLGLAATAVPLVAVSVGADGRPSFWVWFGMITIVNAFVTIVIPTGNSLAMQPMGRLAGTAAAVIGTLTMGGGAILGAVVDRTIQGSVTPLGTGYLVYGVIAFGFAVWARGARKGAADTVT